MRFTGTKQLLNVFDGRSLSGLASQAIARVLVDLVYSINLIYYKVFKKTCQQFCTVLFSWEVSLEKLGRCFITAGLLYFFNIQMKTERR
jgi:hypothetical protein